MLRLAVSVLLLGLLGGAISSCENIPYRVEWGFEGNEKNTDLAPPTAEPTPSSVKPTAPAAWLSWESLHRDLVRIFERRKGVGGPVPRAAFKKCRRAVTNLVVGADDLADPDYGEAIRRYEEIEEAAARGTPPSTIVRRLQAVHRVVRRLRRDEH